MPELKVGDVVQTRYGPYESTAKVIEVTEEGAILEPSPTAILVGYEKPRDVPVKSPTAREAMNPFREFLGRAHWPAAILLNKDE